MLGANIEIKLSVDGTRWQVAACLANIDNKNFYATPLSESFPSKDLAIRECKLRIMAWFKEKGRKETEEEVEWRVP